jgi:hypothetical protein
MNTAPINCFIQRIAGNMCEHGVTIGAASQCDIGAMLGSDSVPDFYQQTRSCIAVCSDSGLG